jgi:hypothetical protein
VSVCRGCSGRLTVWAGGGRGVGLWTLGFEDCQGACGGLYSLGCCGFVCVG